MIKPERAAKSAAPPASGEAYTTLPQKVAADLRAKILLGEFAPGSNIPERETAADLGVSRTPLREALRLLASEGLVQIRPARSPVVANPSAEELSQLFSVMRVLEALAGELACTAATETDIQTIRTAHHALEAAEPQRDIIAFFNADMAFHAAIVAAVGGDVAADTIDQRVGVTKICV